MCELMTPQKRFQIFCLDYANHSRVYRFCAEYEDVDQAIGAMNKMTLDNPAKSFTLMDVLK